MGFFDALASVFVDVSVTYADEPSAMVCEITHNPSFECETAKQIADASSAQDALDAMEKKED